MHMENPDFVSIKTAVRQQASRLEGEVKSARQWASLLKHRGVPEASQKMEAAASSIEEAVASLRIASDLLFEAQEEASSQSHQHPHPH